jgi:hypothetical protein
MTAPSRYQVTTERLPTCEIPDDQRDHALRVIACRAVGTSRTELVADATELLAMVGLIQEPEPPADPLSIYPDCGNPSAYERHLVEHTPPCEPCKAAKRRRWKQWADAARAGRIELPPMTHHGYPGGANAHHLRGEQACEPCLQARRATRTDSRVRQRTAQPVGAR